MRQSDEFDLRQGLVRDPTVIYGSDTSFWKSDTGTARYDTVKNALAIGDTGLVGGIASYSQYLYGDFEFTVSFDSLSPDSNDGASATRGKVIGLENIGDTRERGAAYFEMRFDSVTGGDTLTTRPLRAVIRAEDGTVQRKNITFDTIWGDSNAALTGTRFRIRWESDGYLFLINDSVYATLGDRVGTTPATFQINHSIPMGLRVSNRVVDAVDTSAMSLKFLAIRNARIINPRLML